MSVGALTQQRLTDLFKGISQVPAGLDCWVGDIHQDSRKVTRGSLFIAAEGIGSNGEDYIDEAIRRGAVAIVRPGEHGEVYESRSIVVIELERVRPFLGQIAHRFFGQVTREMTVVGVTGTNGKSSVTHYIAQLAEQLNVKAAVVGTLGSGYPGRLKPATHTTPDAVTLHRSLFELYSEGYQLVALEVSSHALDQDRVKGIEFDTGVFINLSRDHLDYHGSMTFYAAAKKKLFALPSVHPVLNLGDATGRQWAQEMAGRNWTGFAAEKNHQALVWAENVEYLMTGTRFSLCSDSLSVQVQTQLLGWFNLENVLAAVTSLLTLGYQLRELVAHLPALTAVPGRMEMVGGSPNFPAVVVDYAHTPDALEAVLKTLATICEGQLWCVFGCGGDRDRGKRPLMGSAAETWAHHIILTDDNPRSEAPELILADIMRGISKPEKVRIIQPREQAITDALTSAKSNDMVLVAGKGHETYQEIGGHRHQFSDRDIAASVVLSNISSGDMPLARVGGWQ